MAYRTPETQGRPPEAKDKQITSKGTSKDGGELTGKWGNGGKGTSGAAENSSQRLALLVEFMLVVNFVEISVILRF